MKILRTLTPISSSINDPLFIERQKLAKILNEIDRKKRETDDVMLVELYREQFDKLYEKYKTLIALEKL